MTKIFKLVLIDVALIVVIMAAYFSEQTKLAPIDTPQKNSDLFINDFRGGLNQDSKEKLLVYLVQIGADVTTLRYVSDSTHYIRDSHAVYWIFPEWEVGVQKKVEGADPDSFAILNEQNDNVIAHDRSHVYITGNVVPDADPKTFKGVSRTPYYRDNKSIFYMEELNTLGEYQYQLRKLVGADPNTIRSVTFKASAGKSGVHFMSGDYMLADDTHVYLRGNQIPNVDAKTFNLVAEPYFSDQYATYFSNSGKNESLTLLAPTSTIKIFTVESTMGGYTAIGNSMFMGTTSMPGADVESFHVFDAELHDVEKIRDSCNYAPSCPYAADNNFVYFNGKKIIGAEPKTFTPVGYGLLHDKGRGGDWKQPQYASDSSHVYYSGEILNGADPKTFTPLISGGYYYDYGKDDHSVYWKSKLIKGADPTSFHALGYQQPYEGCGDGNYASDSRTAYYQDQELAGVDIKSFKVVSGSEGYAEDALRFYQGARVSNKAEYKPCKYGE